jgi:5-methylcytosine-specific restriction enzyme B
MAVMKVFAGPPGTGKTWRAAREAVEVLRPGTPADQVQTVHQQLAGG